MASDRSGVRRGLPRERGAEPWPPAGEATAPDTPSETDRNQSASADSGSSTQGPTRSVRRGLPRERGSESSPPAATAPPDTPSGTDRSRSASPEAGSATQSPGVRRGLPRERVAEPPPRAAPAAPAAAPRPGAAEAGTRAPGSGAEPAATVQKPEAKRYGPFTLRQWFGSGGLIAAGLLVAVAAIILLVRWLVSLPFMEDFLTTYPGEYHLPEGAPVGFPAWLNWLHFLNFFFMVLIIRSGLQVRFQKRPDAYWTPRWNSGGKVSLASWFHQSLDVLWLLNGLIFVVLLFTSGQWMRIVPTSWEVFPNALSALIQYVSLDWPTENGWVNYNSLQQLSYFLVVFVAAPLAALTGARMSTFWPKNARRLNAAYPIEWARAVHFPTMIFFVLFIVVHITLVFATAALRNLNHMYAAQGSADPAALADNWAGFWIFVASLVVTGAAWVAARPLLLAPVARLFGSVSSR